MTRRKTPRPIKLGGRHIDAKTRAGSLWDHIDHYSAIGTQPTPIMARRKVRSAKQISNMLRQIQLDTQERAITIIFLIWHNNLQR